MKIIGHRGARGVAPENTLASLRAALEARADMVEIDVRVTLDNVPVIIHDRKLAAKTSGAYVIRHTSYAALIQQSPELIRLDQAIACIAQKVPMMIEIKPGVETGAVIAVLRTFLDSGWQPANMLLGSKSQAVLRALQAALPQLPLIVIEPWSGVRAAYRARQLQTTSLAMNQRFLWPGFIKLISRRYQLFSYTLNDPAKAARWETYGLAGIITDDPRLYNQTSPQPDRSSPTGRSAG